MSKALALFDFDGTLTCKDSLGDFILFAMGKPKAIVGGIMLSPILAAYAMGLMDNGEAKRRVLKYFFAGMSVEEMAELGQAYVKHRLPRIIRPSGLAKLKWHKEQGHQVSIVSASADIWLKPWVDALGLDLIATKLEVVDGKLTGNYAGKNCHGEEKVTRIRSTYALREYETIYAYGDSSGDRPMLSLAQQTFYKPFH